MNKFIRVLPDILMPHYKPYLYFCLSINIMSLLTPPSKEDTLVFFTLC